MTTKTINGTSGSDTISVADNGADFDVTLNGNTTGPFADDTIIVNGGSGSDTVDLSALTSASGVISVTVSGGAGNDTLTGSTLDDTFLVSGSGEGSDVYDGGDGSDTIKALSDGTLIQLAGDFGVDNNIETITADGKANVTVLGDSGNNTLDFTSTTLDGVVVNGGSGNDVITGNAFDNTIRGGAGNDTLNGAAGNDTFQVSGSGEGSDVYDGGDGSDTIKALSDGTLIQL
ncbi:MAG: hypothetical protein K2P74_09315, partial [Nitrosomonas sp.]|nr:hypothetical protein [Nitrosomonas sp.]